jgi:hypothetical protein
MVFTIILSFSKQACFAYRAAGFLDENFMIST